MFNIDLVNSTFLNLQNVESEANNASPAVINWHHRGSFTINSLADHIRCLMQVVLSNTFRMCWRSLLGRLTELQPSKLLCWLLCQPWLSLAAWRLPGWSCSTFLQSIPRWYRTWSRLLNCSSVTCRQLHR